MSIRTILALGCVTGLLLGSATLRAQETASPGAASDTDASPPTTEQAEPTAASERPANSGQDSGRDPFDYESSEQISEDLSVSFPVDI